MRPLLLLILLAACDFEPAPPAKKAPAPAPVAAGSGSAQAAAPTPNQPPGPPPSQPPQQQAADAGVADAPMEVKQECVDTGAHLAEVLISEAKDSTQKAAIEQDKTRMIRRVAEACTRDNWKPESLACFKKSTSSAEMDVCAKDLTLKD